MSIQSSQVLATIEFVGSDNKSLGGEILSLAYRASRNGVVILFLRGIAPREIDRALNPIVAEIGLDVQGVRYVEQETEDIPIAILRSAFIIIAISEPFRRWLDEHGISHVNESEGICSLRLLATEQCKPIKWKHPATLAPSRASADSYDRALQQDGLRVFEKSLIR